MYTMASMMCMSDFHILKVCFVVLTANDVNFRQDNQQTKTWQSKDFSIAPCVSLKTHLFLASFYSATRLQPSPFMRIAALPIIYPSYKIDQKKTIQDAGSMSFLTLQGHIPLSITDSGGGRATGDSMYPRNGPAFFLQQHDSTRIFACHPIEVSPDW